MGGKEILTSVIDALETNPSSFSKALGFDRPQGIYDILNGKTKRLSDNMVEAITKKYPQIDRIFLLTGEGDIFTGKGKPNKPKLEAVPLYLSDPEGFESTGEKYYELADGSIMIEVPVIPVKAYAGYLRGWPDPEYYEDKEILRINVDKRFSGTYMCFEVKGESMVNIETKELARRTLWPGSRIIGRDLPKDAWHKSKLHYKSNDAWIIVHRELGIITKEIIDHDVENGTITIHSLNPDKEEYPDQKLDLRDIEQLFNVVDPMKLRH